MWNGIQTPGQTLWYSNKHLSDYFYTMTKTIEFVSVDKDGKKLITTHKGSMHWLSVIEMLLCDEIHYKAIIMAKCVLCSHFLCAETVKWAKVGFPGSATLLSLIKVKRTHRIRYRNLFGLGVCYLNFNIRFLILLHSRLCMNLLKELSLYPFLSNN